MATRTSNTRRRPGRPSNAERNAELRSHNELLIDTAFAAASAALKTVLGSGVDIPRASGVATPVTASQAQGSTSQGSGSTQSQPQGSTSQGTTTASASSQAKPAARARKSPGRRVDPNSKMSRARVFYADNTNMQRSDMVDALVEKLDISKAVANTYVSNIDKENGSILRRRGSGPQKAAA